MLTKNVIINPLFKFIMKKYSVLALLFILFMNSLNAQNWCGSMEHRHDLNKDNPQAAELLEKRLKNFNKLQLENTARGIKNTNHYVVPVVFHIIHQGGTENISLEQVEDQMRVLNEDFARLNPDTTNTPEYFASLGGDAQIEFRLAQIDPQGNCSQGVTRTFSSLTVNARNNVKELIQWDPEHYLNIWVVRTIDSFSAEPGNIVLGFAQFPDQLWTDADTDGVVIRHDYCGSIGTASSSVGRTLTHEAGHWLNLVHIWGDSDCGSDYVSDTPISLEPNYNVCTNNYPWHVGSDYCGLGTNGEMFMNYMDYVDDNCMNMFSINQGTRMRSAINQFRNNLTTDENLIATGTNDNYMSDVCAPITEFSSNFTFGCVGDGFNFESEVYNTLIDESVSYEWTFLGGSPSSSSDQNPTVSYQNPGIYSVSLNAINDFGESALTKESFISVSDDNINTPAPYFQNFEVSSFPVFENNPNLNWLIYETVDPSWQRNTAASSSSFTAIDNGQNNASFRIRSSEFTQEAEKHVVITPSVDLSNSNPPVRLYFDLAYAKKNGNSLDNLIIYVSDDCGRTWTKRFDKDTEQLITNGGGNSFFDFVPNDSHWETFNVSLNSFVGESSVSLKIEFAGQEGNWMYLDNFIITESSQLSIEENEIYEINVYPNPSRGSASIKFESANTEDVQVKMTNIFGAIIGNEVLKSKVGENNFLLNEMLFGLKAGIYFVSVKQKNIEKVLKVIISE